MKKAVVTQIDPTTWMFTEQLLGEKVYCYLLVGDERALLIDTAYGFTDIAAAVREITPLPVLVVNTHAHFDHVMGNANFGKAYLHVRDEELYGQHTNQAHVEGLLAQMAGGGLVGRLAVLALKPKLNPIYARKAPGTIPLPESGCFELGGRTVRVIETPGHTQGSISLLDVRSGWLFSGDTCGDEGMLLHFAEATSVATFHQTIRSIRTLVAEGTVTRNYPCHQTSPAPLERLEAYEELLCRMEAGELTDEEWKTGAAQGDGMKIMFAPARVKEEVA